MKERKVKINEKDFNISLLIDRSNSSILNFVASSPYLELYDAVYLANKFNKSPDTIRRLLKRKLPNNYIIIDNKIYFGSAKTIDELKKIKDSIYEKEN